ncbi:hypothetical protein [Nocardiopsis synnemataformans]|uniref:hypothetical protein n=1 Tax=Nocardiopsis synnemataformans TaxID=61305 RepID=UPI003EBF67A5
MTTEGAAHQDHLVVHPTAEDNHDSIKEESEAAKHTAASYTLAPTAENLAANPVLVVLIGDASASQDLLDKYPAEWVVTLEDPELPGQNAHELGTNIADTPLTVRLRERLPAVLAPHPTMIGELATFARTDILTVASTYGVPAYAVLTIEDGATDEESQALPTPDILADEGWSSY